MNAHRAAAEALFSKGPLATVTVERIVRRTGRVGSIHDSRANKLDLPVIASQLRELEHKAARLTIHRNDPDKFFEDRSELKAGIAAIARQIEGR